MSTTNGNGGYTNGGGNKPVVTLRQNAISLSIWANPGQFPDSPLYSCQLQRSYQDTNGVWQNTDSLNGSDMGDVAFLANLGQTWIFKAREKARELRAQREAAQRTARPRDGGDSTLVPVTGPGGRTVMVTPDVAALIDSLQGRADDMGAAADRQGRANVVVRSEQVQF